MGRGSSPGCPPRLTDCPCQACASEGIEIEEVTSGVWQLRVPAADAQRALQHLQPQEQRSIQTHL